MLNNKRKCVIHEITVNKLTGTFLCSYFKNTYCELSVFEDNWSSWVWHFKECNWIDIFTVPMLVRIVSCWRHSDMDVEICIRQ